ncbi:hypothetical protein [Vulgatibacter sp.]|uniref:hypothetical protein n=1 Tax=Vulgatibacter sp. TaxID=1971226 RepID=UPI003561D000
MTRAALLALACTWAGCKLQPAVPDRPATVPAEAVWRGGAEGGAWIHCEPALRCTVWQEDGSVAQRGRFVRGGGGTGAALPEGWSGDAILLEGGGQLLPDGWHEFPPDLRVRYEHGEPVEKKAR